VGYNLKALAFREGEEGLLDPDEVHQTIRNLRVGVASQSPGFEPGDKQGRPLGGHQKETVALEEAESHPFPLGMGFDPEGDLGDCLEDDFDQGFGNPSQAQVLEARLEYHWAVELKRETAPKVFDWGAVEGAELGDESLLGHRHQRGFAEGGDFQRVSPNLYRDSRRDFLLPEHRQKGFPSVAAERLGALGVGRQKDSRQEVVKTLDRQVFPHQRDFRWVVGVRGEKTQSWVRLRLGGRRKERRGLVQR
jgi:hypothetical protein